MEYSIAPPMFKRRAPSSEDTNTSNIQVEMTSNIPCFKGKKAKTGENQSVVSTTINWDCGQAFILDEAAVIPASAPKLIPTEYQIKILSTPLPLMPGTLILVEAYAGCAKSSTLEMLFPKIPQQRILTTMMNRNLIEKAKVDFARMTHVSNKTYHALGFFFVDPNKNVLFSWCRFKQRSKIRY